MICSVFQNAHTGLGPTQPTIEWVPGTLSLEVKCPAVKVLTQLHLASRLRLRGIVPRYPILLNDVHSDAFIFTDCSTSVCFDFRPGDERFRDGFSRFLQISWANVQAFSHNLICSSLFRSLPNPPITAVTQSHIYTICVFNLLKPSGFFYVPPGLTFKNSTWCSLCVECFVRISEQTATFAGYVIT
jgi:hypothetical protein